METPTPPHGRPVHIRVDRDACQGAANCLAFSMYELDDEVKAVLLTKNDSNSDEPSNPLTTPDGTVQISDLHNPEGKTLEELQEIALESAKTCPFNAIFVYDEAGNQLWPPE